MVEDSLSRREFCFIPKSAIENSTSKIHPGDIIALTTSREGLDISHVGFAVREKDGLLHFLHAPDVNGNVVISTETLTAHVKKIRSVTGIMVVRAAEPND